MTPLDPLIATYNRRSVAARAGFDERVRRASLVGMLRPMIPTAAVRGSPCWAELTVADLDAALAFYGDLFDWRAKARHGGRETRYFMFLDDKPVCSIAHRAVGEARWTPGFATDDMAAT
ncbi:MAG: VOC family protein, partial [Acidimicrobiia bacterium]